MGKPCPGCRKYENCRNEAAKGRKYCSACEPEIIRQMHDDGYLEPVPEPRRRERRPRTEQGEFLPEWFSETDRP